MSKTIVLGDTHHRNLWKRIVNKEEPDRVIFIGDYWDDWTTTAEVGLPNFLDIIELKKSGEIDVIMLLGNHDMSYYPDFNETCSGYQRSYQFIIRGAMADHKEHLQMAYEMDGFLFTHAGVTKTWLETWGDVIEGTVVEKINGLLGFRIRAFNFHGTEPSGDDVTQSCIWVRPRSLAEDHIDGYIQVVGHTGVRKIVPPGNGSPGYFIDTLGTSQEYLIIEDGKVTIGQINKEANPGFRDAAGKLYGLGE